MTGRDSFEHEKQEIHELLLKMGALTEQAINDAVFALSEQDQALAARVIAGDDIIDEMQKSIETKCLRMIALQQPMASDLRFIATGLKIVTDMERVADHAVDIAEITVRMKDEPLFTKLINIPRMAEIAKEMLRDALDSYVKRDIVLARHMCERDDEMDALYAHLFDSLVEKMSLNPDFVKQGTQLLSVAHYLERVADHATNIGEWVIYLVTGEKYETNY